MHKRMNLNTIENGKVGGNGVYTEEEASGAIFTEESTKCTVE